MAVAAVPVKDLDTAKQRLVAVLTPAQRADLARAMLRDVLGALSRAGLEGVWVVTRDPDVAAIARSSGAEVLREADNRGHTAAVAFAQSHATATGVETFVTVPGDVPCVDPGEIRALLGAAEAGERGAVFAPSRSGRGTNAVALRPAALMPLTFGEPSFQNHLAAARRAGVEPRVLVLPAVGLDIDTADDLRALAREGGATESGRLVAAWKIADRLPPLATPRR